MLTKYDVTQNLKVHSFDIETLGWSDPIAVGVFDGRVYKDFLKDSDNTDVIWTFLQYAKENFGGATLHAHNSSNFDNKFILECLIKHNQTIDMMAGLGSLRWKEAKLVFTDTRLLLRTSLDRACEAFDVPKKLDWKHADTKNIW